MSARLVFLLLVALLSARTHARDIAGESSGCDAKTSDLIRGILGYGDQQEQWSGEQVDHVVSCVLASGSEEEWVSHPLFPGLRIRSDVTGDSAMALSLLLTFQPRISPPRSLKPHAVDSRGRCVSISYRFCTYVVHSFLRTGLRANMSHSVALLGDCCSKLQAHEHYDSTHAHASMLHICTGSYGS